MRKNHIRKQETTNKKTSIPTIRKTVGNCDISEFETWILGLLFALSLLVRGWHSEVNIDSQWIVSPWRCRMVDLQFSSHRSCLFLSHFSDSHDSSLSAVCVSVFGFPCGFLFIPLLPLDMICYSACPFPQILSSDFHRYMSGYVFSSAFIFIWSCIDIVCVGSIDLERKSSPWMDSRYINSLIREIWHAIQNWFPFIYLHIDSFLLSLTPLNLRLQMWYCSPSTYSLASDL